MNPNELEISGKMMRFVVKSYGGSEFRYLMRREPLANNLAVGVKHDTYPNPTVDDNIFDGASSSQLKFDPRLCFNELRKLGASKLDEKRKLLRAKNPNASEDINHFCRIIGVIDDAYFGFRNKCLPVVIDTEAYEDALTAALLAASGPIRKTESAFKKLDYESYDIHFDYVNREVIISKSRPAGLRGWILTKLDYGFGVETWRKTTMVGQIRI